MKSTVPSALLFCKFKSPIPSNVFFEIEFVLPICNLPLESMRNLSVDDADPSAVVENINLPGMSFPPGVASTSHPIFAAKLFLSVPSEA